MGLLDRLFGGNKKKRRPVPDPQRRYPTKSIISDSDLKTLADFRRYYSLPEGFEYRERRPRDVVVVRKSDGAQFVFLVEEGILAWDVPYRKTDGSWGKKTTEVLKQGGTGPHPGRQLGQTYFPLGENIISDPDIRTFADLGRHYLLPAGFEFRQVENGVPVIVRPSDGKRFRFLIEEGLLSFDEPYTRKDGRVGYKTIEVFKQIYP
jgi:hypothetical protein